SGCGCWIGTRSRVAAQEPPRMKTVLIVDDEPDIAESLAELFADTYEVVLARDGAEAFRIISAGGIDAVLLDLMMPVMSGETLLAELRKAGIRLPVLLASAAKDLPQRCQQSGAD